MDNPFVPNAPTNPTAPDELNNVYYFPLDAEGKRVGEPIAVKLGADGVADISGLPMHLQDSLRSLGTSDELHQGFLKPEDGKRFMLALVRNSNGYNNFGLRSTEEK